jgi:hypothetical protein
MAKTPFVGVIFSCVLATAGWAATSSPSLIATPPQPKWSELTVPQKIILAPLSDDWDSLEYYRQKKWLGIAARFPAMTPEEQRRIQGQMQEWGKLTPEQRELARENFITANQLPTEKKRELKQKWEEYSSLPDEEKEKIKQQAASKPVAKPGLAATVSSMAKPASPPPGSLAPPALPPATEAAPSDATPPTAETTTKP